MDDDNEDAGQLEPGRPTGDSIEPIDTAGDDDDSDDEYRPDGDEPRRNPPRDWSAPPPWLASSEAARGNRSAPAPDFLARRSTEPGQGLAGSAADQLAGGPPPPPLPPSRAASEPPPRHGDGGPDIEELDHRGAPPPRRPRAYDQHLGGPSSGPDWERPRRYEAYPTIKSRVGMPAVPRLAVLAGLVVLVALGFYFLPAILGLGSSGSPGGGAASAPASVRPSASTVPTAVPAPTPIVYTIKKGDVLSKIAANHGITLEQLMAANKSIKDPNRISEGQEIVIPTPEPDAPNEIGPSASPEASP
jgi:LysM repeat protein